jgi:guanylate kinase
MDAPRPLVVCGPSGVGKGTLIARLTVRPSRLRARSFPPAACALSNEAGTRAPNRTCAAPSLRLPTLSVRVSRRCLRASQADHPALFGFSVSHTTRAPRPGEVNGTHYHFTDRDAFLAGVTDGACVRCLAAARRAPVQARQPQQRVHSDVQIQTQHTRRHVRLWVCFLTRARAPSTGKFLEHAHVHGNIYGTTFEAVACVTGANKVCILDVDVQGAEAVKRAALGANFVFIAPPSMDELERRLRGRGTETEDKACARARASGRPIMPCLNPVHAHTWH